MDFDQFLNKVYVRYTNEDNAVLKFYCEDGSGFMMYHEQDCCEWVYLEDVCGDINDLLNTPLLDFYESSDCGENGDSYYTWTFYTLRTIKGTVTLRWYGTSNGYYSEEVTIEAFNP